MRKSTLTRAATGAGLVLAAALLAGCSGGATADSTSAAGSEGEPIKIAYLNLDVGTPYTEATREGIEKAAAEVGGTVDTFDADLDGTTQQQQCQDAVTSGEYNIIMTIPVTPTNLVSCIKDAADAGIAFVNTDFPIGDDVSLNTPQIEGQVGTVLDSSTVRGDWIYDLTTGACEQAGVTSGCQVGLINGVNADPYSVAVQQVLTEKAEETGAFDIVQVMEGFYTAAPSLTAAADMLQAHPDLNVIVTTSDPMTVGAEQAVKDAGRDDVVLVGGGYSDAATAKIESGEWYGTFLSLPNDEGYLGAKIGIDWINSGKSADKAGIGVSAAEESGYDFVITKENIADFADLTPQWIGG